MSGTMGSSSTVPVNSDQPGRRLVLVTGVRDTCIRHCLSEPDLAAATWISDTPPPNVTAFAPRYAARLLGTEQSVVVFDALDELHPDALGIVAGCVTGGGILALLLPAMDVSGPKRAESLFLSRFLRLLYECPAARVVPALSEEKMPAVSQQPDFAGSPVSDGFGGANAAQRAAIEAVMHVATGQRRKPVILLADRGRGKSTVLGIAAGCLLQQRDMRILVSGRSRMAADQVFRHADRIAPEGRSQPCWVSVETLLDSRVECDLLLLDEAAGIPLGQLALLLERYPRIALATTVHGYEGSGRGFLLRFREHLDRLSRGWRNCTLDDPVRWPRGDPLEKCINRLLMLNAELPAAPSTIGPATLELVDRQKLASDEAELEALFSLLVTAHYRTRPSDLKQLLDDPSLLVYRLRIGRGDSSLTAGVLLGTLETRPDEELGRNILVGRRRPPGHVLAEILAGQAGIEASIELDMLRIRRIVVHPEMQRRGLGSLLLRTLRERMAGQCNLLGTQFALSPGLIRFWRSAGFEPVHVGIRPSRFAGEVSGLFLLPCDGSGQAVGDRASGHFVHQFFHSLPRFHRNLHADIVTSLLDRHPALQRQPDARALRDTLAYCHGNVAESSVIASLALCAAWGLALGQLEESSLVVERVLEGREWKQCSAIAGNEGRHGGNTRLRGAFRALLESTVPQTVADYRQRLRLLPPPGNT